MPIRTRTCVALFLTLLSAGTTAAQADPPAPPRQELDRREALKLYGLGLLCEKDNRLLEAARLFESALQLDPTAAPLHKALVPLYVALERHRDALASCRKALAADPGDFETWYLCSRLCKEQGQLKECREALARALACPKLKEQPDLVVQVAAELGLLCEEAKDLNGALSAYGTLAQVFEHPEPLLELGPFTPADINARAAEVYERVGNLYLQAGKLEPAVQAYVRAQAKTEPDALKKRLSLNLAKVRLAQGRPEEALAELDRYLETQPPGTDAYELKVAVLEKLGKEAVVVPQLEFYARREPHNLALQLLLADRYVKARRWREAENRYLAVAGESPRPEVYRGLFKLYQLQDEQAPGDPSPRLREALHLFDEALAAAARARAMLAVFREDGALVKAMLPIAVRELSLFGARPRREGLKARETCYFLAVLAARNHQLADAERLFRQSLASHSPQTEAEIYGGLIEVLREQRKYKEVVAVCREGLRQAQATNLVLFHANLSLALASLGKYSEALTEADQAVERASDTNRLRLRLRRASLLALAEKYDKAEAECLALLKEATQPGDVRDIRYQLSGVYTAAHQPDRAEEQLRLILQADPNDDAANNDLGYIMADRGKNLEEAEQLIRRAIQLEREQRKTRKVGPDDDKDHAAYIDSLGWVLFRRGHPEEACQELLRATQLPDGDDPVIWDHLGDVYLRLGQPQQAAGAWHKAEQLYDANKRRKQDEQYKELKRKLKLLKSNAHR
jgi:tetratricopeptide (TPR) repeat protein